MAAEQSAELQEILRLLPDAWKLKRQGPGRSNWVADLTCKSTEFRLVCDRGYVNVSKIADGQMIPVQPPDDQRVSISPRQVVDLLLASELCE